LLSGRPSAAKTSNAELLARTKAIVDRYDRAIMSEASNPLDEIRRFIEETDAT
jgi:hypothetical protein